MEDNQNNSLDLSNLTEDELKIYNSNVKFFEDFLGVAAPTKLIINNIINERKK